MYIRGKIVLIDDRHNLYLKITDQPFLEDYCLLSFHVFYEHIVWFQDTLDAVENLLKKHEAFEKSAATQEERFAALEKLTTVRQFYTGFILDLHFILDLLLPVCW